MTGWGQPRGGPKDDLAAVGGGLAHLRALLGADRAAVYLVEPASAAGTLRLVLVAAEPALVDDAAAAVVVAGAVTGVLYEPDLRAAAGAAAGAPVVDGTPGPEPAVGTYFRVPVEWAGQKAGLIEFVAARVDAFGDTQRRAVLALAPLLGAVLGNARRQQAKDSFLALAAHELRTPLATAAGFAQTIAENFGRLDDELIQDLLARIVRSHQRLDRLVDDLVDIASIEGGHLNVLLEPVAVGPLLEEVVRRAENGRNGVHPISCEVAADTPPVCADGDRLEQVLTNLVANAAKFSPKGAPIKIRVGGREERVAIEVIDHGPGIAPGLQDRIFDAYYQGDVAAGGGMAGARPRGLGIGLYLTRLLCELMGATVHVQSEPGRGSTFVVTLPSAPPASNE